MKTHVCELLVDLAVKRGFKNIAQAPGLFEMRIDDTWEAKCNPHAEDIEGVPSYHWYVSFNGWPAGILHVRGDGVLCDGAAGNEDTLREALQKALSKIDAQ